MANYEFDVLSPQSKTLWDGTFSNIIEVVVRSARQHVGWKSVRYKNKRYQLHGGFRTNSFIDIGFPIEGRK